MSASTAAVDATSNTVLRGIERNSEYDPFATIYNRFWGADYHGQAFPVVDRLLLAGLRPKAAVLDVCCGTGQFTRKVKQAGFAMTGLDASEGMISFARRNVPKTEFFVADVRDFGLERKFEAAYSVFESLNHVPDLDGLRLAFSCVHRSLEPGASFLFDLNGEKAFRSYWSETDAIVEDDVACILRAEYDAKSRVGTCDITVFEQAETWTRRDFTVQQTCHDLREVHAALEDAGFQDIALYDACDLGMTRGTGFDRTFFLAKAAL